MDASTGSTFGELLRSHRNSANLTQEDLAERTGLTPQAIGLLERGERRRPHRYTVEKLAEALGLTGQDLARFRGGRTPLLHPPCDGGALPPTTFPHRPHPWSDAITRRRASCASCCARTCAC